MVVVGHVRLPQSLCPPEGPTILIELEVGSEDGLITGVNLSGPLPSAGRLLTSLLVGRSMETDYGQALLEFQRSYIGPPQKAICTALNAAQESYRRRFRRAQFEPLFSSRLDRRTPAEPEFR